MTYVIIVYPELPAAALGPGFEGSEFVAVLFESSIFEFVSVCVFKEGDDFTSCETLCNKMIRINFV